MSIEAMKQALEALELERPYLGPMPTKTSKAITSLRQAIAEAEKQDGDCQRCGGKGCVACDAREQEPVAWMDATGFIYKIKPESVWPEVQPLKPLYIHPQPKREWIGLTAEDWENLPDIGKEGCERDAEIFDWIEATLKAKNT